MVIVEKIKGSHFIKKIIESFFGRASFTIFSMFFSFVCARIYGVEIFGKYTYAFTVVSLIMVFAKAGLDNGLIYYIPKSGNKYISFGFFVNFIASIFIVLVGYFYIDDYYVKISLPLVWILSVEQIFFGIYRANNQIKEFYLINGFYSMILKILLAIAFYFLFGKNVENIIFSVYVSSLFSIIFYFLKNKEKFGKINFDSEFIKYSLPLVVAAMMGVLMGKIDIIMLGSMIDKKSVGIYQIASQIAGSTSVILMIFNTVFAPKVSQLYHAEEMDKLKEMYVKSTRFLGITSLFIILVLCLLSKYILLIFGKEFVSGQWPLIYRSIGQFLNASVGSVWLMLAMTGKSKLQMYGNLLACILNISLNYVFIKSYGINGAAIASMISIGFVNILGYILVKRQFKVKAYWIF
ncbi:flippase [uncultured Ilyobacter sp.]|uniref:flippase n=1 Tax=uncultured Ilyobacter sp. TaxID=544433 RepID=UPI0029C09407|nr:flippase [uncultured Ilyobacter sp.]